MTRLTDLPPAQAKRVAELDCLDFETRPWATGPALSCSYEVAQRLTPPEPRWRPGFHPPPGVLSSSCSPAPRTTPLDISVWYTVGGSIATIGGWAVLLRLPRW